ncbi:MAG TPA: MlaD family protein [Tepidisphaeraceae bacterium]|jgi:ABC-type transporter Mla subunit MlaD
MSEQANYFKVGVFVIVAVALMLMSAIMLGAGAFFKQVKHAETYFTESVSGLDVGAPIKFRGVTVGRVSRITFASVKYHVTEAELLTYKGYVLVELEFDPKITPMQRFDSDFTAKLVGMGLRVRPSQTGIVGGMYLEIVFLEHPEEAPPLALHWEPEYPYIPATSSRVERITTAVERLANQLEDVRVDVVIDRVSKLAAHLDEKLQTVDAKVLTDAVVATLGDVRKTSNRVTEVLSSPEAEAALKDLPDITARVRSSSKRIDELLTDAQSRNLLTNANTGVTNLNAATGDLRRLARQLENLVSEQQQDVQMIIAGLRRTLDNTTQLTDDARQNPSRLLFGEPPPRSNANGEGNRK